MKKILLSCACCLLAVGLLAGCDNEEEVVTPEEPETTVPSTGGDDGGGGDETETTYKLGVLNENLYSYYYFDGTLDGRFASGTDEWDKGVSLTVTTSEEGSTLSWEEEGVTYYLGYGVNESNQNIVTITTEVSYLVINEEHDSIEDPSGKYFLGTYNEYTTFSWNGVSYYDKDFVAHLYTSAQTNPIAPAAPEPTGEMVEVETGVLGLYQGNKGNYYYFTGEINSSNFGVLSTDFTKAIEVTEWKDDAYYYLTIGSEESLQYIACPATSAARMSLTSEPYCLLVDETTGAFVTGDGKEFLGTYRDYETMCWSDVSYLGQEGQFIATIYKEEQKLPAPEAGSITISGATSVYVGSTITLTATIPTGYDSSVEWSIDNSGYATIEESSGLTCVVKGVSEGSATVTVKSTANPEAYATTTISVVSTPTGVTLLGSFDFSTSTITANTIISEDDALDDFWTSTGYSDLYLGAREHDTVYFGNSSGGAFGSTTQYLKFGTGSGNSAVDGLLQLKFAVGTSISEVVVTAHSWDTNETDTLTVNGTTQNCSQSGSVEALTYTITDEWTYLLTMESSGRVFVQTIEIYGTYDSENVPLANAITIAPESTETLNVGESDKFTVSWEEGKVFDIDTLTWTSSEPEVVSVESTTKGATAHALAVGTATISASNGTITSNEVSLTVEDVLQESETINISDYGGSGSNVDSKTITAHQVSITIAKGNGGTSPRWDSNMVRVYAANTITFTPLYDNATISKIEFTYDGNYFGNDEAQLTDSSGSVVGTIGNPKSTSGGTITIDNITSSGVLTFTNWVDSAHTTTSGGTQLRFTSITVYYTLA